MTPETPVDEIGTLRIDETGFRIWVDLVPNAFGGDLDPPRKVMAAARTKMLEFKEQGRCDGVEIYEARFEASCERLRRMPVSPAVSVLIAAGTPILRGAKFEFDAIAVRPAGLLTLTGERADVATWHPGWLPIAFRTFLRERGVEFSPDAAALEGARLRYALLYETIDRYRVSMAQTTDPAADGAPWLVRKHRQRQQIDVLVGAKLRAVSEEQLEELRTAVVRDSFLLGAEGSREDFVFINQELMTVQLADAAQSQLKIGIESPQAFVGALLFDSAAGAPSVPTTQAGEVEALRLALPLATAHKLTANDLAKSLARVVAPQDLQGRVHNMLATGVVHFPDDEQGPVSLTDGMVPIPLKCCSESVSPAQRAMIHYAINAIDEVPSGERSIQAMTIAVNEKDMRSISAMQRSFVEELLKCAVPPKEADRLMQINLQLYPFTRLQALTDGQLAEVDGNAIHPASDSLCGFLIREMVGLFGFNGDARWIAARLYPRLDYARIEANLDNLVRLGLLQIAAGSKGFSQSSKNVKTEETVSGTKVMQFHRDMIHAAHYALDWAPADRRQYLFLSLPLNQEGWARVNLKILSHLGDLFSMASEVPAPDQIYQVSLQAFPLMKLG